MVRLEQGGEVVDYIILTLTQNGCQYLKGCQLVVLEEFDERKHKLR